MNRDANKNAFPGCEQPKKARLHDDVMKGKDKLVWKPVSPDSMSFLPWDPFPTSEVLMGLLRAPSGSPNKLLYPEGWGISVESHCKNRNPVKIVGIDT